MLNINYLKNKSKVIKLVYILVIKSFLFFLPQDSITQQTVYSDRLDAILVIDGSGSMRWNDPSNLRIAAANLFISLANNGDKIGIIDFSTHATVLRDLTEIRESSRKELNNITASIKSKGAWTDITQSLALSYQMMEQQTYKKHKSAIILLTDGHIDLEDDMDEMVSKRYLYDEVLPKFASDNWPIFSIALSDSADFSLLEYIASITGGGNYKLKSSNELMETYLDIFSDLGGLFVHKFQKPANATEDHTFYSDGKVEQLIVAIVPKKGLSKRSMGVIIKDPDMRDVTPYLQRELTRNYSVYRIKDPRKGSWTVQAVGPAEGTIFLGERLSFFLGIHALNEHYDIGDTIKIAAELLQRMDESRVTDLNIIRGVNIKVTVWRPDGVVHGYPLFDDGRHDDEMPLDGLLAYPYLDTQVPGIYHIMLKGTVFTGIIEVPTIAYRRTVKIGQLLQVIGPSRNDSLKLNTPFPIKMSLLDENGKVENDAKILSKSRFNVIIQNSDSKLDTLLGYDDGNKIEHGDEQAQDASYSTQYVPNKPGKHAYYVIVNVQTIARQDTIKGKKYEFYVLPKESFFNKILSAILNAVIEYGIHYILGGLGLIIIIAKQVVRYFKGIKIDDVVYLKGIIEIFKKLSEDKEPECVSFWKLDSDFDEAREVIIGRMGKKDPANKIGLEDDGEIEENHIKLIAALDDSIFIETIDQNAKIEVNGKIVDTHSLTDKDEIKIGSYIIRYKAPTTSLGKDTYRYKNKKESFGEGALS